MCAASSAAMLSQVYEPPETPLPTRVVASSALLRAGLERAARIAGLTLVAPTESATITLHCDDDLDTDAPVDVRAGLDRVTVTMNYGPGPETWAALQALIRELSNETGAANEDAFGGNSTPPPGTSTPGRNG